jgi:uncharacterized protein (TIGR03382 family)
MHRSASLPRALGALAVAGVLRASVAHAETFTVTPADDLIGAVASLQPGDELVVGGGTYNLTQRFGISLQGTEAAPIVIRAADGETPIVTRPDAGQNAVNIEDAAWVELRGLEITGGSHGIRIADSDFITIEGCHIHDTGDVGLSANVPGSDYEGLRFLRNHIHHTNDTGEGMYLGCNDDGCQFHDGLIEVNYIHHTNGPTVAQGDGIELKEGSYGNVVRDNVIHDTNYPCIITYSTVGNGPPNRIERNALWGCGDHGIQAAADVVIVNNVILGANADGIRNQPHQAGDPANILIAHNTILKPAGDAIRSDGIVGSVVIANNAIYAQGGDAIRLGGALGGVTVVGNVGIGTVSNVPSGFDPTGALDADLVAATFSGDVPNDVFPKAGGKLVGVADPAHLVEDDFNGAPRAGSLDVGAYRFDAAGNPGWPLAEEPKGEVASEGGGGASAGAGAGPAGAGGGGNGAGAGSAAAGGESGESGDGGAGGDGADEASGCDCATRANGGGVGVFALLTALAGLSRRRAAKRGRQG